MATLKLRGVGPFDGDYELDAGSFNMGDYHTIKQIAGIRAGELQEAQQAGDLDLLAAFAVIALERAGKTATWEQVKQWTPDVFEFEDDLVEVEPRPPASPSPNGNENKTDGGGDSNETTEPSGSSSNNIGDPQADPEPSIGLLGSETFSASAPEILTR